MSESDGNYMMIVPIDFIIVPSIHVQITKYEAFSTLFTTPNKYCVPYYVFLTSNLLQYYTLPGSDVKGCLLAATVRFVPVKGL